MLNEALSRMARVFDATLLSKAKAYQNEQQVLNVRLSDGLLKGRIKGSSNQIFDVHMDLKTWPDIPSRCTCSSPINCEHAAACLLVLYAKEMGGPASDTTPNRLDRKLDVWLKSIHAVTQVKQPTAEKSHVLVYLLTPRLQGYDHTMVIKLALAKILKRGGLGKKAIINSLAQGKKQHFTEDDDSIVAELLFKCGVHGWFDTLIMRNSELLEKILATKRAYLLGDDETPLELGATTACECVWELSPNGEQHFVLKQDSHSVTPVLLDTTWYFNPKTAVMGRLLTPYPPNQLRNLLDAPPIRLEQAPLVVKKMADTCPQFPTPYVFEVREVQTIVPKPILILDVIDLEPKNPSVGFQGEEDILFVALLKFDYAGVRVSYKDIYPSVVQNKEGTLYEYPRDSLFEDKKFQELENTLSLSPLEAYEQKVAPEHLKEALMLTDIATTDELAPLYEAVGQLKELDWQIEFQSPLYKEQVHADELEWFSELKDSGNDFFSYQLGILVEGKQVNIVPLVAELIARYSVSMLDTIPDTSSVKLPLSDGRVLLLEIARIKPLIRLLLQFGAYKLHLNKEEELQLTRYQLVLMEEAELAMKATKARWQGSDALRMQLQQLLMLKTLPHIEVPKGLQTHLRDYQHQGLNWLQFLRTSRFGGVLADDMGLGKTIQALAHLQVEKEQGRIHKASLIIAPTSLVGNWLAEAARFTPELKVLVFHGSERHQDDFDTYDIVVSTYGLIQRDKTRFVGYDFYYLILDEAQFIKNARTKTTQIIQQLKASHRLCLTGTPLENHLGELWSLFNFLMPGLLGDVKQFRQWFRTPIEKNGDLDRHTILAKRVKPFMLRRTKNEVVQELPLKTEMLHTIELLDKQRDLYEAIRMSMEKKVREAIAKQGLGKSHILLLDALLKLRQVCCDPRLLSMPEAKLAHGSSSKLDALMGLLDNLIEEGRRVLVFSQFTSMLSLIEEQLIKKQYEYLKLTGKTQNRQAMVDKFQQEAIPIFLISLKAGGTGLNLTKADTVIHYDPWWNPAVQDQATDRSHRIGQENPVFVYKLITAGTVEEAILKMQNKKRHLAEGILTANQSTSSLFTESDIAAFFAPLDGE